MTGSVWAPGSITTVNSANTVAPENQVGTQGQTLITLLNFTYPPNTNSILLWINGVLQASGIDYTEASASTLLLTSGLTLGDRITVLGLTAIIGSTSALTFVRPSGSIFLNGFSATPAAIGPGLIADYGNVPGQARIRAFDWATATDKALSIDGATLKLNTLSNAIIATGTGQFQTGGSAAIGGPLDLSAAAAGQILFPATQNPSAGANVLDDYEEGTFTLSNGGNTTYTIQEGQYIKIGKLVFLRGRHNINVLGTGSNAILTGAPFVNSSPNPSVGVLGIYISMAIAATWMGIYMIAGSTSFSVSYTAAATATVATGGANFGNSSLIDFSLTYQATA